MMTPQVANLKGDIEKALMGNKDGSMGSAVKSTPLAAVRSPPTTKIRRTLKGHFGKITALHWSGNSRDCVSASQDGNLLVWNAVTKRRHELTSMGIRVNADTLKLQLELTNQLHFMKMPYHQGVLNNDLPLSIGGGIGQSRTFMLLLKKAHIGEVSATVWPKILKDMCRKKNIHVIE